MIRRNVCLPLQRFVNQQSPWEDEEVSQEALAEVCPVELQVFEHKSVENVAGRLTSVEQCLGTTLAVTAIPPRVLDRSIWSSRKTALIAQVARQIEE
jgi:hypothetical protein